MPNQKPFRGWYVGTLVSDLSTIPWSSDVHKYFFQFAFRLLIFMLIRAVSDAANGFSRCITPLHYHKKWYWPIFTKKF